VDTTLQLLLSTAVGVGFIHTVVGVDHSLPFVVLGRARGWSLRKTLLITGLCGMGHVLSSVVIGMLGLTLGVAVARLQWMEAFRGNMASWVLIVFGTVYAAWSLARQRRRHRHTHRHAGGVVHTHEDGTAPHTHGHEDAPPVSLTLWGLFIVFVLGPCEPLIPLVMVPALTLNAWAVALVVIAFGVATIGTMLVVVAIGHAGMRLPAFERVEPHVNTIAGLLIAVSGVAIRVLGI